MSIKIHHVALTVSDIDRSRAWYRANFDAEVTHRYKKHGVEIVQMKIGEAWIELFSGDVQKLPEYRKTLMGDLRVVGTKHVALETDELPSLVERLRKNGVSFETETDSAAFGGQYVFIKDPDGILIELYQKMA